VESPGAAAYPLAERLTSWIRVPISGTRRNVIQLTPTERLVLVTTGESNGDLLAMEAHCGPARRPPREPYHPRAGATHAFSNPEAARRCSGGSSADAQNRADARSGGGSGSTLRAAFVLPRYRRSRAARFSAPCSSSRSRRTLRRSRALAMTCAGASNRFGAALQLYGPSLAMPACRGSARSCPAASTTSRSGKPGKRDAPCLAYRRRVQVGETARMPSSSSSVAASTARRGPIRLRRSSRACERMRSPR
jgi:hypothetical protein